MTTAPNKIVVQYNVGSSRKNHNVRSHQHAPMNSDLQFIESLVSRGGPHPMDYPALNDWFSSVHLRASQGVYVESDLLALRAAFGDVMSSATLQGFVCAQPHGYPGDFEIIDKIYVRHLSPKPHLVRWDAYFHSQPATKAVRNRKDYFHALLDAHSRRRNPLRVLKLASGPGRSMFEWLSAHPDAEVSFTCVELDSDAIAYATALNQDFLPRIVFQQQNIVRIRPNQQYDLIWAAGLFDYFADNVFQSVVRRVVPSIAAGGELVIGNFASTNPSRAYMEFGGWALHHRTPEALASLALGCGVAPDTIRIGAEPEGVNLFLHVAAQ